MFFFPTHFRNLQALRSSKMLIVVVRGTSKYLSRSLSHIGAVVSVPYVTGCKLSPLTRMFSFTIFKHVLKRTHIFRLEKFTGSEPTSFRSKVNVPSTRPSRFYSQKRFKFNYMMNHLYHKFREEGSNIKNIIKT